MNIVIVESAAKAKTINKYLGRDYKVIASYGHVRDLPSTTGMVEPENDFEMHWDTDGKSSKILKEITQAVKGADKLILATDPDREGEAISWHILQVLEKRRALKDVQVERVAFNAITRNAILEALQHPRTIDEPLVSAYLARRALDYLVGFTLSPVLWRKLPGSRSAGRVQSVALRLLCDRELEIEVFKPREYWTIEATLKKSSNELFQARLFSVEGKKLEKFDIPNDTEATTLKNAVDKGQFWVKNVQSRAQKRNPSPPFTTSTLQQEASRKLGFVARQTMQVAQKLYEGVDLGGETVGLITYMRTDGVQIIPEAVSACRTVISEQFGKQYLPRAPREYKTKAKNAQEAHEAIRPTDLSRLPAKVRSSLDKDSFRLYSLIWQRTIASQMQSAEFERTTADIAVKGNDGRDYTLRATGSVLRFDGFLKLYQEGKDEVQGSTDNASENQDDRRLPVLEENEPLKREKIESRQHFTEAPPRYSEATLVKQMEELGIGRPSTYASTLSVLRDRGYMRTENKRLVPEDKGRLVTAFLESFFQRYVEYDFTADLEQQLDLISDGALRWKDVLRDFWKEFASAVDEIKDLRISEVLDALNDLLGPHLFRGNGKVGDPRECPACEDGQIGLKVGRFGAFIGCTNYPECRYTRQFSESPDQAADEISPDGKLLGVDPDSGLPVTLRTGRFGPYVQLGGELKSEAEDTDNAKPKVKVKAEKPKRASIPNGYDLDDVDLDFALSLLALPRIIGDHPETGKPIKANFGRYGPYLEHDGFYANLDVPADVFTIGANRAVTLIAEKQKASPKQRASVIKELGEHPQSGGPIQIMTGRYGPYVKHGKINATIPKGLDPETIAIEQACELIKAKAEKGGKKQAKTKAKATKKTDKKTTTKTTSKNKSSNNKSAVKSPRRTKSMKSDSSSTETANQDR